ncbi:hypothetical protein [Dactylosporangium sp. CA-233914]|uniref:hypothetical protein n=1 Tax=Dactylosporangium sp. CA-233914 TaxID=3239934 RepID=UPI003D93CE48
MSRILGLELRRSAAAGAGLLALATGALLLTFPQAFAGRWLQLAVTGRLLLMVLVPVALAAGAWLGRREGRSRVGELFASTARPRWQRVLPPAAALAATLVAAYALIHVIGAAWVVPTSGYFPAAAPAVAAVGALSLVAAAWLGMAAGRAFPRLITAPALAVAGFGLAGVLPQWLASRGGIGAPEPTVVLLSPILDGNIDDYQTVTWRVTALQALWIAMLAATGLLLLGASSRRTTALALVPALAAGAVTMPLLPRGGYAALPEADPAAVRLVCDTTGAPVCVTRVHAGLLAGVTPPARQALELVAARFPGGPTRAVETVRPGRGPHSVLPPPVRHAADTVVFDSPSFTADGRADLSDGLFLPLLLMSIWDQDCGEDTVDADEVWAARGAAAAWLRGTPPQPRTGLSDENVAVATALYQTLTAQPQDEQRRRILAAREAALACDAAAMPAILEEGSS